MCTPASFNHTVLILDCQNRNQILSQQNGLLRAHTQERPYKNSYILPSNIDKTFLDGVGAGSPAVGTDVLCQVNGQTQTTRFDCFRQQ